VTQLVDGAATISYGTATAINFIEEQDDGADPLWIQNRRPSLDGLYNVQDLGLTPERMKTTLKSLVIRAQRETQPLTRVSDHCGYFTSVDLKDIYPWEKIACGRLIVSDGQILIGNGSWKIWVWPLFCGTGLGFDCPSLSLFSSTVVLSRVLGSSSG
jgi:hypothetical protein